MEVVAAFFEASQSTIGRISLAYRATLSYQTVCRKVSLSRACRREPIEETDDAQKDGHIRGRRRCFVQDVPATSDNFTLCCFHLETGHPRSGCADLPAARTGEGDHRRGFGQAVALQHLEAEGLEVPRHVFIEFRPAASVDLPAEPVTHLKGRNSGCQGGADKQEHHPADEEIQARMPRRDVGEPGSVAAEQSC